MLAIATALFVITLTFLRQSLSQALWLAFVATAILTKGKTYEITLIPKDMVPNAVFDVNVILPFYIADAILIGLIIQLWRIKKWQSGLTNKKLIIPALLFVLFIANTIWLSWQHLYGEVIMLSVVQLIPLLTIIVLPSYLFYTAKDTTQAKINHRISIYTATQAILGLLVFVQICWAITQYWLQGPMGVYVEGKLPGFEYGIATFEDLGLFRATGWFVDPALLGTFLFCGLIAIGQHSLKKQDSHYSWLWVWFLGLCMTGILLTLNRILITCAVIYLIFWLYYARKTAVIKITRSVILIMAILVLASIPIINARFKNLATSFKPYGSGWYRVEQALYVGRMVSLHPFGVGLGLSQLYLANSFPGEKMTIDPAHPHNIWLQLLAETGLMGALLYIVFIASIYRDWISRKARLSPLGAAGLAYLYSAQFYPIFINQSELLRYCFIFFGCYLAELNHENQHSTFTS